MPQITLQTRFLNFISWIRPDPDKADDVRKQRDDVRSRIKAKAQEDGVITRSMPASGSFAKATGLRRHMLGGVEHEGQDVDCPFVVAGKDKDGDPLTELLSKFEGYAKACYPDTEIEHTKSSVKLQFAASKGQLRPRAHPRRRRLRRGADPPSRQAANAECCCGKLTEFRWINARVAPMHVK